MIRVIDITFRMAGRVLLEEARLSLAEKGRFGLIGRNGVGKSTLLRILEGSLAVDGGSIALPQNLSIGRLAQHAPNGDDDLLTTVLAAGRERIDLLAEAETATDPARIAAIHARLTDIDAHSAPARAAEILAGLGFDAAAQKRACKEFSGGWRLRVGLASLLFAAPDLLLLDEPTNHLDLEATLWLEDFLSRYRGTIIIVSHDRQFLNRCVDHIILMRDKKLTLYRGNYDQFEQTRALQTAQQAAMAAKQEAQRQHMQQFVDRFRAKATKARQAQSRLKALQKMVPIAISAPEEAVTLSFPSPANLPSPILTLEGVTAGYDGLPILKNLTLRIDQDDRIALLGANGNGKSTFLRLLAGGLKQLSGDIHRAAKLKIGYFDQHQTETLDMAATPLQILRRAQPDLTPEASRAHLARFGLGVDHAETLAGQLSGGERAKLLLALICRNSPHLLLLDEPTNHLDIATREGLVEALNDYSGAIVMVSHDAHFLELTADRLWLVADGSCNPFEGDLAAYRDYVAERNRAGRQRDSAAQPGQITKPESRREQRRQAAQNRLANAPLLKAVKEAETSLNKLMQNKARIEARLADPALYAGQVNEIAVLQKDLARTERDIAHWEENWLRLQEKLEESEIGP